VRFVLPGWKMYMTSVQAWMALENFKKLEAKAKRFDEIRNHYNNAFGLSNKSRHLYRLRTDDRDEFMSQLKEKGVQCGIHYRSVHDIECYNPIVEVELPLSIMESNSTVSIPYHEMLTDEEVETVIKEVKNAI
jgi:dTDP-4-amino-4,6-dideoxygalactose transaminase